jgi:hypothetical protein
VTFVMLLYLLASAFQAYWDLVFYLLNLFGNLFCNYCLTVLYCIFGNLFQNQFFISGLSGDDMIRNRVSEALYRRIMRAYNEKKSFRVIVVIPLLPGFQVLINFFFFFQQEKILHLHEFRNLLVCYLGGDWWWWCSICESHNALAVSNHLQRAEFYLT